MRKPDHVASYILPEDYDQRLADIKATLPEPDDGIKDKQAKARLTADLISSLTDTEALALHRRLIGLNLGSVLDKLPF